MIAFSNLIVKEPSEDLHLQQKLQPPGIADLLALALAARLTVHAAPTID